MLWVFGFFGAALAALWLGKQVDRLRGKGDERWANRIGVGVIALFAGAYIYAQVTGGGSTVGPTYRGMELIDR